MTITATVTNFEGKAIKIKVGDYVGFKCDIEQYAKVSGIVMTPYGARLFFERPEGGFEGEYIRDAEEHAEYARDCWVD